MNLLAIFCHPEDSNLIPFVKKRQYPRPGNSPLVLPSVAKLLFLLVSLFLHVINIGSLMLCDAQILAFCPSITWTEECRRTTS